MKHQVTNFTYLSDIHVVSNLLPLPQEGENKVYKCQSTAITGPEIPQFDFERK